MRAAVDRHLHHRIVKVGPQPARDRARDHDVAQRRRTIIAPVEDDDQLVARRGAIGAGKDVARAAIEVGGDALHEGLAGEAQRRLRGGRRHDKTVGDQRCRDGAEAH